MWKVIMAAVDDPDLAVLTAVSEAFDSALPEIPADLHRFALQAFQWRTVDTLAELIFDSMSDEFVGARGAGTRRAVQFRNGDATVTVTLNPDGLMTVSIHPGGRFDVTIESTSGVTHTTTDEFGDANAPMPTSAFRLRIGHDGQTFVTPWVTDIDA